MNLINKNWMKTMGIDAQRVLEKGRDKIATLEEECHAFEEQYQISKRLADTVITNFDNGIFHFNYDCIFFSGKFKNIYIEIVPINEDLLCRGELYSLDPDKRIIGIKLYIDGAVYKKVPYKRIENELSTVISHELMHCNILLKRNYSKRVKNKKINDAPVYYKSLIKMLHDCEQYSIEYDFARALYLYFYQETQAIISQGFNELKTLIEEENYEVIKNEDIKYLIQYISAFRDFTYAKKIAKNILNGNYHERIIKALSNYNINFNEKELQSISQKIFNKMDWAINKLVNNCYHYCWKYYGSKIR